MDGGIMKTRSERWSKVGAPVVFGLALTLVIASCGKSASPTAPGASAAAQVQGTEEPVPDPTPPPPPPPGGGEGCTPGYWKQDQHFDSWPAPYTPSTLFSVAFPGSTVFGGRTLLSVLSDGGGGLTALGRHAVAALLNAASGGVDYDYTTAQVISRFNAAVASGDYETQKNLFAGFNEQGCPLD
jgi:hypothetical protein